MGLQAGASAVVTNGRILNTGPAAGAVEGPPLVAGDFALLQAHALSAQFGAGAARTVFAALDAARVPPPPGEPPPCLPCLPHPGITVVRRPSQTLDALPCEDS